MTSPESSLDFLLEHQIVLDGPAANDRWYVSSFGGGISLSILTQSAIVVSIRPEIQFGWDLSVY